MVKIESRGSGLSSSYSLLFSFQYKWTLKMKYSFCTWKKNWFHTFSFSLGCTTKIGIKFLPYPLVIDKIARYVLTHFRTVASPDFFKAAFFTFGYFKEENKVVVFFWKISGCPQKKWWEMTKSQRSDWPCFYYFFVFEIIQHPNKSSLGWDSNFFPLYVARVYLVSLIFHFRNGAFFHGIGS